MTEWEYKIITCPDGITQIAHEALIGVEGARGFELVAVIHIPATERDGVRTEASMRYYLRRNRGEIKFG